MSIEHSRRTELPLRPRSKSAKHSLKDCKDSKDRRAAYKELQEQTLPNTTSVTYLDIVHPFQESSHRDDHAGWVVVQQTGSAPSSSHSQESLGYGVGQRLSATNVQLLDTLNNSPPSLCMTDENAHGRLCHRRCPKCRRGSVKTHASSATRNSCVENAGRLDPWAPINLGSYETDFLAVGAWDQERTTSYNYPATV
ncbi:hypothetical protein QQS21_009232 [Conoideocrella luteorostrata]|uniref:Uncharacterized protein n=1 Tax=Conoideocrella luteorostrata TaxID=1105319 RepID=A0AAJ0FQG9_9HYPO|nr:hypothetical protein QQS21_009232 [Conoideocrella luteorostrata]